MLFDGSADKLYSVPLRFIYKDRHISFFNQDLMPWQLFEKEISTDEMSYIHDQLGYEVIDFDEEKIYQGRKKGLSLYALVKKSAGEAVFFSLSVRFSLNDFRCFWKGFWSVNFK